jgi:hypothetical protein
MYDSARMYTEQALGIGYKLNDGHHNKLPKRVVEASNFLSYFAKNNRTVDRLATTPPDNK